MNKYFERFRGVQGQRPPPRRSLTEICLTTLAAFLGIWAVYWANRFIDLTDSSNLYLIGSFGASAVLVYGAPASDFSQPRNLVGGHALSAIIGILTYKLFPDNASLAGAMAVSLAIAGMFLTRTVHPPGGATALIVIINPKAHELGFGYLFAPVLSGALIMLLTALLINNLSSDGARRYPRYWF